MLGKFFKDIVFFRRKPKPETLNQHGTNVNDCLNSNLQQSFARPSLLNGTDILIKTFWQYLPQLAQVTVQFSHFA
jgi:hypothetical protein